MQMLLVLFLIVGVLTSVAGTIVRDTSAYQATAEATATGDNMRAYYGFLKVYAAAHPSFTGTVADSTVPIPTWFSHGSTVQNYLAGGKAYVYNIAPPSGLVGYLSNGTIYSINVGTNQNGTLAGPNTFGQPPIAIPAGVPNNSVVVTN